MGHRLFCPNWELGLKWSGVWEGLKKYGLAGILALVCSFFAFYIGLYPFDNEPTIWKVLIEGFIYYISVGIIEELYVRGFLMNLIEKLFHGKKNAVLWAVFLFVFPHLRLIQQYLCISYCQFMCCLEVMEYIFCKKTIVEGERGITMFWARIGDAGN